MAAAPAIFLYSLKLGDNALVLGHRLSEWCGHGPVLEEDIALSNIALDLVGQARAFLTYAAEVEGKGKTEDDLAFHRDIMQFRNHMLAEQPNHDFAFTIIRQLLHSNYSYLLYKKLKESKDATISAIAEKALKEVTYHLRHAGEWTLRMGDGTEESNQRAQNAINDLWMFTDELFINSDFEKELITKKIAVDNLSLEDEWKKTIRDLLLRAKLNMPDSNNIKMASGSNKGRHTEHLGHLLADMQFLPRAYPQAKW
ncbi:MAG: 1,2-phenylacetyl-CoA epoxidase subunit PaaC [Bacteroidia bacterium]